MAQSSIVSTNPKIILSITHNPLSPTNYVDLAQCLSIVNRRSYRQAMNYAVASVEVFASTGGRVFVFSIPTTWVADNATTKAFEAWKDQRAEVLKEQPSLRAKWADFKIFMDSAHATAGVANNLTPNDGVSPYLLGEWQHSEIVVPVPGADQLVEGTAQEVSLHVVGNHIPAADFDTSTTSVGLIKAYVASRARVLAPDPVPVGQYLSGFYNRDSLPDEMSQDVMSNVANRNDEPPYDIDDYPGGENNAPINQFVDIMIVRNWGDATQYSSDSMGSFVAPFGLLSIHANAFDENDVITVIINCVPGKYKGILAERGV